jgi:CDP-diacylglycerol---glycerol-3-phosphate 3-phosphatidyltransferase
MNTLHRLLNGRREIDRKSLRRGARIANQVGLGLLTRIARGLNRLGVSPDMVTYLSLCFAIGSAIAIATNEFGAGALLLLSSGFCDLIDGHLARTAGRCSRFGALLDSTIDRVSDGAPLIGLTMFYSRSGPIAAIPAATMLFAYSISYIRARAESLGLELPWLWMRRGERLVLMVGVLLLGKYELAFLQFPAPLTLMGVGLLGLLSILGGLTAMIAAHSLATERVAHQYNADESGLNDGTRSSIGADGKGRAATRTLKQKPADESSYRNLSPSRPSQADIMS